jgi:protoporphyrinogen oxidase
MKDVIIFGTGPAGLSAGYILAKEKMNVEIYEAEAQAGGISKTIKYKGNLFDLGGHRFFTKYEQVNILWKDILGDKFRETNRLSRIYYKNKFFNYPLTPLNALFGVGIKDTILIFISYLYSKIFPYKKEETFEEWITNRFGKKLFSIFFKTYTEKVWGCPCNEIQAEWAAQRIKGLSLSKAVINAIFKSERNTVKTLIDKFYYPESGPGMMYDEMKNRILEMGCSVILNSKVNIIFHENNRINKIEYKNNGKLYYDEGKNYISSMPITELINKMSPKPPEEIINAALKLKYRSLVTVDIVVKKEELFPDNWIYIHSPEVKLGRIQNFKNWSISMVKDKSKTTLGLEYFCNEDDEMWNMKDEELFNLASSEVEKIKICKKEDIEDYIIVRVPKAYPVYSMGYKQSLNKIIKYLKGFENLQLIGRYGLFKYNNMDHSIMTGIYAAENIKAGEKKFIINDINADDEYHEEKSI